MISAIQKGIKMVNSFTISAILVLFYIFIIPWGKLIYIIHHLSFKENIKSYWKRMEKKNGDLSSPY